MTFASDAPKPATSARGAVNLRIEPDVRRLIDLAAATVGKSRTEFMIESARRQAEEVLLDQRLFQLDPDRFDAFVKALDEPTPRPKLRALMVRTPAWHR